MSEAGSVALQTSGPDRDEILYAAVARARASAFYSQHLRAYECRSRADFTRLPLTDRDDLQRASPDGMLAVPRHRAWHYHESSGTTGEPISTWCGLNELRAMAAIVYRMVPELAADTMLLNRFPLFAPVSFVFEEALRLAGACHIAAGNLSWDVPFTRALDFIQRLKVTALASLPLEPILLRELALMQGLEPRALASSLRVVFAGGAVLPAALRRAIEHDWDARVVEIYGSNETMLMGVGCTAGRLHLCTDLLEIEVLDPVSHAPVPPGETGVLTVTSLVHEVMPLVRYFTGDLVRLGGLCPCGQTGLTAEVFGRIDDIIKIGGATATAYGVLDATYEVADRLGTRVFFVLVRRRGLHVLFELSEPPATLNPDAAARELATRIGLPVTVEYLGYNEVLDRSALFRTPKIYKPTQLSDWRGEGRKTITIMEALLEWPRFDARTLFHIARRQVRNARRRGRLLREDRTSNTK